MRGLSKADPGRAFVWRYTRDFEKHRKAESIVTELDAETTFWRAAQEKPVAQRDQAWDRWMIAQVIPHWHAVEFSFVESGNELHARLEPIDGLAPRLVAYPKDIYIDMAAEHIGLVTGLWPVSNGAQRCPITFFGCSVLAVGFGSQPYAFNVRLPDALIDRRLYARLRRLVGVLRKAGATWSKNPAPSPSRGLTLPNDSTPSPC